MDAAVATKTIWKNQSELTEYPLSTTAEIILSVLSSAANKANSASDGLYRETERPQPAAFRYICVHEIVADQVVHDTGDRVERDVLKTDRRRVSYYAPNRIRALQIRRPST